MSVKLEWFLSYEMIVVAARHFKRFVDYMEVIVVEQRDRRVVGFDGVEHKGEKLELFIILDSSVDPIAAVLFGQERRKRIEGYITTDFELK